MLRFKIRKLLPSHLIMVLLPSKLGFVAGLILYTPNISLIINVNPPSPPAIDPSHYVMRRSLSPSWVNISKFTIAPAPSENPLKQESKDIYLTFY